MSLIARYKDDDEKLGTRVHDLFGDWIRPIQDNFHKKILYLYRLYHGYRPRAPKDGYSNIHIPLSFTAVETLHPRIVQACTATDPPFHANPREKQVDRAIRGEIVENLIGDDWRRTRRLHQFSLAVRDQLICGTGVEKGGWSFQMSSDGRILKDRPEFRRISALDLAWDPSKTHPDDTPIIHWMAIRKQEILDWAETLKNSKSPLRNLDRLAAGNSDTGSAVKSYTLNDLYRSLGMTGPLFRQEWESGTEDNPYCVLVEYWDEEYSVLVDLESKMPLTEARPNVTGMKPFFFYTANPTGDFFFGKGIIEPQAGLQEATNQFMNVALDQAIISTHPLRLIDKDAMLNIDHFTPEPNKVVPIGVPTGKTLRGMVETLQNDPMHNGWREMTDLIMQHYERTVGQSITMQGATATRAEAYGTTALQKEQGADRYSEIIRQNSETLAQTARFQFLLMKKWQEHFVMVGVKGRSVPLEVVQNNFFVEYNDLDKHPQMRVGPGFFAAVPENAFEFIPSGASGLASREYQQQGLTQLAGQIAQDPYIGIQPAPAPNVEAVEMRKMLTLRMIASMDITGKDQLVRAVTAAYDAVVQAMMAPPPPAPSASPPPPGEPTQPSGEAPPPPAGPPPPGPPPAEQRMTPPEQVPPVPVQQPQDPMTLQ